MTLCVSSAFQARVRHDEPMSLHTSWRVGGPAEIFYTPRDIEDLVAFLRALPTDTPLYWVGLGTNLLVREGGIRGVVISTWGAFTRLERRSETQVYCEAGVPCSRLARQSGKWGLGAAEFFSGIPGTAGGALAMNAGAFGGETWRHVIRVQTIDRHGVQRERIASDFRVAYREVRPAAEGEPAGEVRAAGAAPAATQWFLAAYFEFPPRSEADADTVRTLAEKRKQSQPLGERSCGSVFRNPPGDHAARLIEAAGLKGYRIGDAVVSDKHANFILNQGQARAPDIEALIHHVQATVQRIHGVRLEPEVRIIGDAH